MWPTICTNFRLIASKLTNVDLCQDQGKKNNDSLVSKVPEVATPRFPKYRGIVLNSMQKQKNSPWTSLMGPEWTDWWKNWGQNISWDCPFKSCGKPCQLTLRWRLHWGNVTQLCRKVTFLQINAEKLGPGNRRGGLKAKTWSKKSCATLSL